MYSLITDYEWAVLAGDSLSVPPGARSPVGVGLLSGPIIFAIKGAPAVLFVVVGFFAVLVTFLTRGHFSDPDRLRQVDRARREVKQAQASGVRSSGSLYLPQDLATLLLPAIRLVPQLRKVPDDRAHVLTGALGIGTACCFQ